VKRAIKVIITGGGSGGHVYPALAIGEIIKEKYGEVEFLFVGTPRGAESKIVPSLGIPFKTIEIESFRRKATGISGFAISLGRSITKAHRIIKQFKPDLLISTGGYVSLPVLFAGRFIRKFGDKPRIFIHEQNVVAGLANRAGGKIADIVGVTFLESKRYFPGKKVVLVGYPLRKRIKPLNKIEARQNLGIPEDAFLVFAFGGSSGSRTINRSIVEALPAILEKDNIHVIHAVGHYRSPEYDPVKDTDLHMEKFFLKSEVLLRYHRILYAENIDLYYSASDIVVCRAGSGTLFELKKMQKPAILIPKMDSVNNHQYKNAISFEKDGGGIVLKEEKGEDGIMKVDGKKLSEKILFLFEHPEKISEMEKNLAQNPPPDTSKIIGEILEKIL